MPAWIASVSIRSHWRWLGLACETNVQVKLKTNMKKNWGLAQIVFHSFFPAVFIGTRERPLTTRGKPSSACVGPLFDLV